MSKSNGKGVKGQKERAVVRTSKSIDFRCRFFIAVILLDATGPWLYSNILAGIGGQKVQRGRVSAYFSCLCDFSCHVSYPLSTMRSWRGTCTNVLGTALFFPQLFRWCRSLPQPWARLCKSNININLWATRQSGISPVWCSYNHPELRGVRGPQLQQYLTPSEIRGRPSTCQTFLCSLKNQIHPHTKISNKIMNHSGTREIFHSVPGNKINFCLSPVWEKCQDAKQKYTYFYMFSLYSL